MTVVCLYTRCQGLDKMKAKTQEPLWKAAAPQTPHGWSRARAGTASLSHHLTHASASKELAQALLLWLGRGQLSSFAEEHGCSRALLSDGWVGGEGEALPFPGTAASLHSSWDRGSPGCCSISKGDGWCHCLKTKRMESTRKGVKESLMPRCSSGRLPCAAGRSRRSQLGKKAVGEAEANDLHPHTHPAL